MEKLSKSNHKYNINQLAICSQKAADNIDSILDYFSIEYRRNNNGTILSSCPIHGGDNQSAFNLYPDNEIPCIWICNTMACHKKYTQNIFGLIHALLQKTNKKTSYEDAIDWLMFFLKLSNQSFSNAQQEHYLLNNRYNKSFKIKRKKFVGETWLRKDIQKNLIIPADYYIRRKYSTQIVAKYDIGVHPKNGRIYIPIYNNEYTFAIGFTSRSPYEKCIKCKKYHNPTTSCPDKKDKIYEKWVHSPSGFMKGEYLFNYWFAQPYIKNSKTAIIVEGPGDVLKLEDNSIHNSIATFGTSLCEEQRISLERLGVTNLVCLYDNDDAGNKAKRHIEQECSRNFYLHFPSFNSKDIGDASPEELTNIKNYLSTLK